jgi:SAM-dependent methyltransferase
MQAETVSNFQRYLAAKRSIDDRSLNRVVWERLKSCISGLDPERPLRVLEIGAGIGTMVERVLEWDLFRSAEYTAVDRSLENLSTADRRLRSWAEARQIGIEAHAPYELTFRDPYPGFSLHLIPSALNDFLAEPREIDWDLIIAHAFLDLVDLEDTLPQLFSVLRPGGIFYFTLNFDGATIFEPTIDPMLDAQIRDLYHQTMDHRVEGGKPSGDSRTGRHLFHQIDAAGGKILEAGASDWVIFPRERSYREDEAYFLHFIVETIREALERKKGLNQEHFSGWVAQRHRQIDAGDLIYIAHQIDLVGTVPTG